MMCKRNPMLQVCIWMILLLASCALMMPGMFVTDRIALLIAAAVVACVFMACQSRVERAQALLSQHHERVAEKTKPPEYAGEVACWRGQVEC